SGVTDTIVRLTADNGLVGWGECTTGPDAASVEQAVRSAAPFVIGRDPWQSEAIARDFFRTALWDHRPQTGNFAFAGIDQALWDLCGKACGQPLYRLFGGALRQDVDYFYYLSRGSPEHIARQAADGVARGYTCFYLKVGVGEQAETAMLDALREAIGPSCKIRVDANQAWNVPQAARLLNRWDAAFGIDFAEAPVPIDPVENMRELRGRVPVALCANEGLGRVEDCLRVIRARCADVLCFSSYWVGSLGNFLRLSWAAHWEGQLVCKHTHGELGIAAAAGQHALLAIPNAIDGAQQTAALMADDILTEPIAIASGPRWGAIEQPGLGIEIDEAKLNRYHECYLRDGQFLPYRREDFSETAG
ncbi:MAG TPA: mandelate racemase/muconate lactonizing enzyme family protein, partial [Planctomycetaceae bacterium]|nr:mandelate racemase/muconate lactonizing enzyme family protein [Planctomycetaceae bacterium]